MNETGAGGIRLLEGVVRAKNRGRLRHCRTKLRGPKMADAGAASRRRNRLGDDDLAVGPTRQRVRAGGAGCARSWAGTAARLGRNAGHAREKGDGPNRFGPNLFPRF